MPTGQELPQMAAATVEVTVDGKVYKLKRMTLRQYAELEAWAKEQPIAELEGQLAHLDKVGVTPELRDSVIREAIAASRDPKVIADYMDAPGGIYRRFEMSLREHHPDITSDEISAVADRVTTDTLRNIMQKLTGLPEGDDLKNGSTGPGEKNPAP